MSERHIGLTKAIADGYEEAARVCLDRHHNSPITFVIQNGATSKSAGIEWAETDEQCRAAWANEIDTTEAGAYGCALASVEMMCNMVAIRRAETKTGADYYVAPLGTQLDDLESCMRLEVSGTDRGSSQEVKTRLLEKLAQARRGQSNLPALAAVVGFKSKIVAIRSMEADDELA